MSRANEDARRALDQAQTRVANRKQAQEAPPEVVSMTQEVIYSPGETIDGLYLWKTMFDDGATGFSFYDEKRGHGGEYYFSTQQPDPDYKDAINTAGGEDYKGMEIMDPSDVRQSLDTMGLPSEYWEFYLQEHPEAADVDYQPIEEEKRRGPGGV